MNGKPSFFASTFSLMALIVVVGFTGLCLWQRDVASLKELVMLLLGSYGVKKGVELQQKPPEPVPKP